MVDITEEGKKKFTQYLARKFQDRNNIQITNFSEITEGWETKIYSFSLKYESDEKVVNEDLILRFYQGLNPKEQARKEFNLMEEMGQLGIPVPRVDLLVTDYSPFRNPFILMEKINGQSLANVLSNATEDEILDSMKSMATHFVKLHQIPYQRIFNDEKYRCLNHDDPQGFVETTLSKMKKTIHQYELYEFNPFLNWLEERIDLGGSVQLSVMHNDYHPLNIILRESNGDLVIIDWSFAEIGDYRLDLAWTALLFSVMVGPQYRDTLVKIYEDIAGTSVKNFEYFEVLKFTMRMLTIATWLDESVTIPVNKITRQAMRTDYKIHILNVYNRLHEITGLKLPSIENL